MASVDDLDPGVEAGIVDRVDHPAAQAEDASDALACEGIDDELAAEALSTLDADQEEVRARELAGRRLGATRGLPDDVRVRRVTGMLGRKGYSGGLAHRVVRELLAEERAPSDGSGTAEPAWHGDGPDDDEFVLAVDD